MQNTQALEHINGLMKYVCEYISKFDEGNYALLCEDIRTGQLAMGKTHLHNTKIMRSNINEKRAFPQDRMKRHPKGTDMPHFEIRQIVFGDHKVFTNLNFEQIATLPFELRFLTKLNLI